MDVSAQCSRRAQLALAFACVVAFASCGGGGGDGYGSSSSSGMTLTPTLASIQLNVFTPICTACHTGASAPQGLRLDDGTSCANLINAHSPQDSSLIRVVPGNPNASFIIQKLEGTQTVGVRMPANGPPYLPQSTIDVIRQWIANGATC
jgi:hypothetical protein